MKIIPVHLTLVGRMRLVGMAKGIISYALVMLIFLKETLTTNVLSACTTLIVQMDKLVKKISVSV